MTLAASGQGSRVEWEESGYVCQMTQWRLGPIARHALAASHMGTAQPGANQLNNAAWLPGKLDQGLDIIVTIHADPEELPPITRGPEYFRLVFPRQPRQPFAIRWRGRAFATRYELRGQLDDVVSGELTMRFTGSIVVEYDSSITNSYTEEFEWDGLGPLTDSYTEEFEWDGLGPLTDSYTEEFED